MNLTKTSAVAVLACLVANTSAAQTDNPWNPNPVAPVVTSSQYAAPVPQIVLAQATSVSRYAPADLEQRLSAVKPARPVVAPIARQSGQAMQAPMQPSANGQSFQMPMASGYPNNGYPQQFGNRAPQQGYPGYPPSYGQQGYNNYGNAMPFAPGNYPGGIGGFTPYGGFPNGGNAPFNFSPFGFF